MRPWLSVIMPTYNGEAFLAEALASVAAQRLGGVEVIAVDDGSTDATLAILRQWSRRLPLIVIERPHSGNWVESTVRGMAAARGQYVSWLHQDDTWANERLAALGKLLEAHPRAALVVHPCWYTNAKGKRIGYWRCPLGAGRRLRRGPGRNATESVPYRQVAERLLVQCSIAACGTIFSAEAVEAVGPPDAALTYHADWDYWLRLARLGRTLYYPTPLASFRIHAASQTIARADEADGRLAEARAILRRHLPHFAACGGDAGRIEAVATVSAELNHALNSLVAGQAVELAQLMFKAISLGPAGWATLLRDSRIIERCLSRLQASAGLRPALLGGLRSSLRRWLPRREETNCHEPGHELPDNAVKSCQRIAARSCAIE